ncbi:hypothetical protein VTN77DRAFT_21 [Rasamsonia byssochlamydoides]|uniref:uncharacterized protein n=1 Tax=Rasamsonia byssochlamydoides TaxID=89139 RepID=UPI003742BEE9
MEIGTFIALFLALTYWGTYGSVPFTTIHLSRPLLDRLGSSFQATTVAYTLDSVYQHYNPPNTTDEGEATFVVPDPPEPIPKAELDHLMEMVREEYAEKGNVVILFPTKTATPIESTVLSPVTLLGDYSSNDTHANVARPNITAYRQSQKPKDDDAKTLAFIGIISVIYIICKSIFGHADSSSESILRKLEEFEDRLLQRVSQHVDQSLAPFAAKQEESARQSFMRETTAKFDSFVTEFRELQREYARSAAPRPDPVPPVNVHINPKNHEDASTLESLHSERTLPRTELNRVHEHLDNIHEESKTELRNVEVQLAKHFDTKLDKLQKALSENLENIFSKRMSAIERNLLVEDRQHLRSGLEALSKRVASIEKGWEEFFSDQTPTNLKGSIRKSLNDLSEEVASLKEGLAAVSADQPTTDEDIQYLHTNLETVSKQVSSIEKDLKDVFGDKTPTDLVNSMDARLKTLSERVTSLEQGAAALSSDQSITGLTRDMEFFRLAYESLSDKVSFMKEKVEAQSTTDLQFEGLHSSLKTLSERISSIEKDVAVATGNHDQPNADLAKNVEDIRADFQTLTERVSSIKEELTAVSGNNDQSTAKLTKNMDDFRTSLERQINKSEELAGQARKSQDSALDAFREEWNQHKATVKKTLDDARVDPGELQAIKGKIETVASHTVHVDNMHQSLEKRFQQIYDNLREKLTELSKLEDKVRSLYKSAKPDEPVEEVSTKVDTSSSEMAAGKDSDAAEETSPESTPAPDEEAGETSSFQASVSLPGLEKTHSTPVSSAVPAATTAEPVVQPSGQPASPLMVAGKDSDADEETSPETAPTPGEEAGETSSQAPVSLPGLESSRWAPKTHSTSASSAAPAATTAEPVSKLSWSEEVEAEAEAKAELEPEPDAESEAPSEAETVIKFPGPSSSASETQTQSQSPETELPPSQGAEQSASPSSFPAIQAVDPSPDSDDAPESSNQPPREEARSPESEPSPEPEPASHEGEGATSTDPTGPSQAANPAAPATTTPSAPQTVEPSSSSSKNPNPPSGVEVEGEGEGEEGGGPTEEEIPAIMESLSSGRSLTQSRWATAAEDDSPSRSRGRGWRGGWRRE